MKPKSLAEEKREDSTMEIVDHDLQQNYEQMTGINEQVREERMKELTEELENSLAIGGFETVHSIKDITDETALIEGRVKSLKSVRDKMKLLKADFEEITDIWGLRVVVEDRDRMEEVVGLVSNTYLDDPRVEDLTRKDGRIKPAIIDWSGSNAPSSHPTHDDFEAIFIKRRGPYGLVQVQLLEKRIYERIQNPADPLSPENYDLRRKDLLRENENL